jgi:Biopolymer transport protein ExbD/TolR
MIRTGIRRHKRHGKGGGGHGPLALVPMIDMLTILVVYLLVHTADMEILPNSKNISIPQSNSEQKPREATVVMVTREMLYVNGHRGPGQRVVARGARRAGARPVAGIRGEPSSDGDGGEVAAVRRAAQDRRQQFSG